MNVHDGCGGPFKGLGKQAPKATVDLYNTTQLDCYKVAGAMCKMVMLSRFACCPSR
eukprot:COSAG04_NODE_591_length_12289_cov_10.947252_6_plen_56_part_00